MKKLCDRAVALSSKMLLWSNGLGLHSSKGFKTTFTILFDSGSINGHNGYSMLKCFVNHTSIHFGTLSWHGSPQISRPVRTLAPGHHHRQHQHFHQQYQQHQQHYKLLCFTPHIWPNKHRASLFYRLACRLSKRYQSKAFCLCCELPHGSTNC